MKKLAMGIDIGGTNTAFGLVDEEGTVFCESVISTEKYKKFDDYEAYVKALCEAMHALIDSVSFDFNLIGIGIGAPGPVDAKGVIYRTANLGWDTVFSIPEAMQKLINVPVKAGNDANVAGLGELWMGGGKGYKDMVMVTLGTGVGGGIVVDGNLVSGALGAGGEIGHIHVEDNETDACGCGKKGCLEQYASATGVVRLAKKRLAKDDKASVLRNGEVTAKAIWDAAKAGDELALEVAKQFGTYLGKGLGIIAAVVNPKVFVVGGGVSKAGEVLFEYIIPEYKKYSFAGCWDVEFKLATLGNDAGIYGAAKLVIDEK